MERRVLKKGVIIPEAHFVVSLCSLEVISDKGIGCWGLLVVIQSFLTEQVA